MKGYNRFLFYYSVIIQTFLLIGSFFFLPTPQNIIFSIAFLPIALYFWIKMDKNAYKTSSSPTPPIHHHTPIWPTTPLAIILCIGIVTIPNYAIISHLSHSVTRSVLSAQTEALGEISKTQETMDRKQASSKEIMKELASLKQQIEKLRISLQQKDSILQELKDTTFDSFASTSATPTAPISKQSGQIIIADTTLASVNIVQEKTPLGKIIGHMVQGKQYTYVKKEDDYYYVTFSPSKNGWVNQRFVREVL